MAYTTVSAVRTAVGIGSSEISDADVTTLIADAQAEVDRLMNTTFEPKRVIDYLDEYTADTSIIYLNHYPVTKIRSITIDGTGVSQRYVKLYRVGELNLLTTAQVTRWDPDKQANVIDYDYADLKETTTSTSTDGVFSEGITEVLVTSASALSTSDYVKIYGTDGFEEITQISAIDTNSITVGALTVPHVDDSLVVKMEVPQVIVRLTNLVCGLMMVARIVGESYTDIVGYSIEGLQVQKGEPYTQWRETAIQLRREYDEIIKHKRIKAAMV